MNLKDLIFNGGVKGVNRSNGVFSGSVQEWLPVKSIFNGVVITKDNRFVKILEVLPVNFYLKSPADQQNIIAAFAAYLKIAPDTLQIAVLTQRADMASYTARMRECIETEENEKCRIMIEDNISEIVRLSENDVITRRFFIAFQYEPQMKARRNTVGSITERLSDETETAMRYLDACGLEVIEPRYADNALLELLYELLCKATARRVKLPKGVFDMTTAVHGIYE